MIDALPGLKILRKVPFEALSPGAQAYLVGEYERRKQSIDPITNRLRSDVISPIRGWVDNDLPRDEAITDEIREVTKGFALAGYLGQIIREFKHFEEADKARSSAKVTFDYGVNLEEEEVADEPVAQNLAGTGRRQRDVVPA